MSAETDGRLIEGFETADVQEVRASLKELASED